MRYSDYLEKKKFANSIVVPTLIENNFLERATNISKCGDIKRIAICKDCGTAYYNGAWYCKDKFCPVCQKRRSLLWLAKLFPIFENLIDKGYYINLVTFTIVDTSNLKEGLDLLNNAFRYLQGDNKEMRKQFNDLYIGGIRALEVKTGKNSQLWHPHYHMLVVKNTKSNFKDDLNFLRPAWIKSLQLCGSTADIPGNVDIQSLKINYKFKKESLIKAICECFKYLTKSSWINETEDICEMINNLDHVRAINSWGNIRYYLNKINAEAEIEKEMNMSNTELQKHVCKHCGCKDFITIDRIWSKNIILEDFEDYKYYGE